MIGKVEIMHDNNYRQSPRRAKITHKVKKLMLMFQIKGRSRLVQQQAGAVRLPDLRDDPRKLDPLLLPPGQGGKGTIPEMPGVHQFERLISNMRIARDTLVIRIGITAHRDNFMGGKGKADRRRLRQHSAAARQLIQRILAKLPPVDQHTAFRRVDGPCQAFEKGGFPCPVGTQNGRDPARLE